MSISSLLEPYAAKNYDNLFTANSGALFYRDRTWLIQKPLPEDFTKYGKEIIDLLKQKKVWKDIPKQIIFSSRLNQCMAKVIPFNSRNEEYAFLSNFYSVVIKYKDHNSPSKTRFYSSSENAYQAHKVAAIKWNKNLGYIYGAITPEDLEQLAVLPPSESKNLADALVSIKKTDVTAKMKYHLMRGILREKFKPDTLMAQKLLETGTSYLVEDTSDAFWGSKKTDISLLDKYNTMPISRDSCNVLGRILMEIRTSLHNPKSKEVH
jgi:ribA/ribD-fused uncharacterized protein